MLHTCMMDRYIRECPIVLHLAISKAPHNTNYMYLLALTVTRPPRVKISLLSCSVKWVKVTTLKYFIVQAVFIGCTATVG